MNLSLSLEAMDVVRRLADETNSTPEDVLKNSVALYKLAIDARKKQNGEAAVTAVDG